MLRTPTGSNGWPLPVFTLGPSQNVTCNAAGGGSTQSTAFNAYTEAVMVSSTTNDVRLAIGDSPTATTTSTLFPKPFIAILAAPKGGKIAVISNDTNAGSVSVTELQSYDFPSQNT